MDVKLKIKEFWESMQAWVGASPYKSTALAVVCMVAGALLHAMLG